MSGGVEAESGLGRVSVETSTRSWGNCSEREWKTRVGSRVRMQCVVERERMVVNVVRCRESEGFCLYRVHTRHEDSEVWLKVTGSRGAGGSGT